MKGLPGLLLILVGIGGLAGHWLGLAPGEEGKWLTGLNLLFVGGLLTGAGMVGMAMKQGEF